MKAKWRSWRSPHCVRVQKKQPFNGFDEAVSAADVALASRDEKQRAWIAGLPSLHDCRHRVVSYVHHTVPVPVIAVAAEVVSKLPGVDRSAVKRECRFRNVMRARGGRVRTNEEMCGVFTRDRALEECNLAVGSTDDEMKSSGAWRVRSSRPDGSTVLLPNVFAPTPGRVMYLHDKRRVFFYRLRSGA